ncbi:GAF domain-containing protein [Flammeovirga yaeyamensis]|uniref:GAF domain-containing protein n=1 Tax=Flammeovirga yaeyamensis TaxID=367791 RepID=A0AAX1N672_9BACT|nr:MULTISPECIES: GAF domain-containing protein [Flammeovirga]ANQ49442.1 GAF domain-containing protein [Flammeovirga sp. MY04]MBB3697671.1 chaperonin cofactor prefoldin [Flammeovirga yaeyamensis]NMF35969.1 GAF domain-containing protein [Flammeovirga yaeyamensis]QWG03084.1 GAF domain-containing protein [Flammeovirga yaeyamensis]
MNKQIGIKVLWLDQYAKLKEENKQLKEELNSALHFSKALIEDDKSFELNENESSELMLSIDSIRQQREKLKVIEMERGWVSNGLTKFVDILRTSQNSLEDLCDQIINNLVSYLGVTQGGLFVVNESLEDRKELNLISAYAYERKKYLNRTVKPREGLVGQVFIERKPMYLKEVPEQYINITSGLGKARPTNLFIAPMLMNDDVYGIIELASLNEMPEYQREFVLKLGETIASTIASTRNSDRMKSLLEDSQIQAEQMRAQEEEMRQNVEELQATQEEMHRKQKELEATNAKMQHNEGVLTKAFDKLRTSEETYKTQINSLEVEKSQKDEKIEELLREIELKNEEIKKLGGQL